MNLKPVEILLLISELEGCCTYTKKYGFDEHHEILKDMRDEYYKLYFQLKKQTVKL